MACSRLLYTGSADAPSCCQLWAELLVRVFTLRVEETWRAADATDAADAAHAAAAAAAAAARGFSRSSATRLHAGLQEVTRGPERARNRDLAIVGWSTCKSSYIRNQGTALIRMVPVWDGGPPQITSYLTSPIYLPLAGRFWPGVLHVMGAGVLVALVAQPAAFSVPGRQ